MSAAAPRLRGASLFLGGIAGFLGLIEATFSWLLNSFLGGGFPLGTAAFAVVGLVGAAVAKHRPRACAAFELIAGIGLLAGAHMILGSLFLAGAMLALAGLRTSPPGDQTGKAVRADVASAFTVVGVAGLAVVVGLALLVLGFLALAVALSGGSSNGLGGVMSGFSLTIVVATVLALALLVRKARRRN